MKIIVKKNYVFEFKLILCSKRNYTYDENFTHLLFGQNRYVIILILIYLLIMTTKKSIYNLLFKLSYFSGK